MVGSNPSVRVHGYVVVGPKTRGHRCGEHGGEGWKAGAPRVGRRWDVESSGQQHIWCGGGDTWRVAVVAGQHATGRGASDGAGWHVKGSGGGTLYVRL